MRVLFVCSGNSNVFSVAPFIKNQADSLKDQGVDVDFFLIKARGIRGYLRHIAKLKKHIKNHTGYDVIHAHYSFSGWVCVLTGTKTPIVLSLMGSDTYGSTSINKGAIFRNKLISMQAKLIQYFCKQIIVKSEHLNQFVLQKEKSKIIPNGVNLDVFKPLCKESSRSTLNLASDNKVVLFIGNPEDKRKNIKAANEAVNIINKNGDNVQLLAPFPVENTKLPIYFNACDVLVFPSKAEGSPNAVKEAMACNMPIVATDVGDVKWLFGKTKGLFISDFNTENIAANLKQAFAESSSNGRDQIKSLGLDAPTVAIKLISIYKSIIN